MKKHFLLPVLMVPILFLSTLTIAEAAPTKVMWGKTELKIGQIGKITVISSTPTYQMKEGVFKQGSRSLKKGDEYRVYSYKGQEGGYYGLGGGLFVKRSNAVKYETPSKAKLALLKIQELSQKEGSTYPDGWVAPVLKSKWSSNHATNLKTLQNELGFENGGNTFGVTGRSEAVQVIGQSPSSSDEVELLFYMWTDSAIPESYRIPIVAKELFKLYFGEDATRVWNYLDSGNIPDRFTANGRNVTVLYDPNSGGLLLELGRK